MEDLPVYREMDQFSARSEAVSGSEAEENSDSTINEFRKEGSLGGDSELDPLSVFTEASENTSEKASEQPNSDIENGKQLNEAEAEEEGEDEDFALPELNSLTLTSSSGSGQPEVSLKTELKSRVSMLKYGQIVPRGYSVGGSKKRRHRKPNLKWQSAFQGIEENFHKIGNRTYLFRAIIIGEYENKGPDLVGWTELLMSRINANIFDEIGTGFFLLYPNHFVHVIEGSESALDMYIDICARELDPKGSNSKNEYAFTVNRMIVLGYFAIKQRKIHRWFWQEHEPLENRAEDDGAQDIILEFTKRTILMALVASKQLAFRNDREEEKYRDTSEKSAFTLVAGQQLRAYIPALTTIKYLLDPENVQNSIQLLTPNEFIRQNWTSPNLYLSTETDWPIPARFAPYD